MTCCEISRIQLTNTHPDMFAIYIRYLDWTGGTKALAWNDEMVRVIKLLHRWRLK